MVWSHWEATGDGSESCVSVYDAQGALLARLAGVKAGQLDAARQAVVSVDEWVARSTAPELDASVEMIRPSDVLELHSMVVARMQAQAPLCVLAGDEEVAAYVRAVRAECPGWALQCIVSTEDPAGAPVEWAEGEWRLADGRWSVRRLAWADAQLPLVSAVRMTERGELSNLRVVEARRAAAGAGRVEVLVRAVGRWVCVV